MYFKHWNLCISALVISVSYNVHAQSPDSSNNSEKCKSIDLESRRGLDSQWSSYYKEKIMKQLSMAKESKQSEVSIEDNYALKETCEHNNLNGNSETPHNLDCYTKAVPLKKSPNFLNDVILKHRLAPTADNVNSDISKNNIQSLESYRRSEHAKANSLVCYACSNISSHTCNEPNGQTTVKHCLSSGCRKNVLVIGDIPILVRDCGNNCNNGFSSDKCSICNTELCNNAFSFNNVLSMFNIILLCSTLFIVSSKLLC